VKFFLYYTLNEEPVNYFTGSFFPAQAGVYASLILEEE
jgi:hypothetical protein